MAKEADIALRRAEGGPSRTVPVSPAAPREHATAASSAAGAAPVSYHIGQRVVLRDASHAGAARVRGLKPGVEG
eukprot:gene54198-59130_t